MTRGWFSWGPFTTPTYFVTLAQGNPSVAVLRVYMFSSIYVVYMVLLNRPPVKTYLDIAGSSGSAGRVGCVDCWTPTLKNTLMILPGNNVLCECLCPYSPFLSVSLTASFLVSLSVSRFVCLSVSLSVSLSLSHFVPVFVSFSVSLSPLLCLSVCLSHCSFLYC